MKLILCSVCSFFLFSAGSNAQSPVTLNVYPDARIKAVPHDFLGLSFETATLINNNAGVNGYLFDSTDTQLLTLFKNLAIRNLRIGGDSVDTTATPSRQAIDSLFGFARAADLKVIYSLRLANGDSAQDASIARYILDNYRQYLQCFAIGNEPNLYGKMDPEITGYPTWLAKWERFAEVVIDSVPGAKFGGPDVGTGGWSWDPQFSQAQSGSGILTNIFSHYYVGGVSTGKTPQQLIDNMLSTKWDTINYPKQYAIISNVGLPYRLTESNSYVAGNPGVWGGNNSFATALFALDYAHWWAIHGCAGVNFHTYQWKYNGTVYQDSDGNLQVYPIAYGIRAFDVGGHGTIDSVVIGNPDTLDLTAYAVTDSTRTLFITIINREYGTGVRDANVTIKVTGSADSVMYLVAPNDDIGATSGVTLGGASITNNGPWQGKWILLDSANSSGCLVRVPGSSAAIVKLAEAGSAASTRYKPSSGFSLYQNYPNPFNASTQVTVSLKQSGLMSLKVYNVFGQLVKVVDQGYKPIGEFTYSVRMDRFASGVYFYTLQQGSNIMTKKMLLLK